MSDCRMSGTAFGTIVLHITPEAAAGGPLALVESGDRIRMSVARRSLDLLVDDAVLARRRAAWRAPDNAATGLGPDRGRASAAGGRGVRPGGDAGGGLRRYAVPAGGWLFTDSQSAAASHNYAPLTGRSSHRYDLCGAVPLTGSSAAVPMTRLRLAPSGANGS